MAKWSRICLQCRRFEFDPRVGKIPWRRKWQPTPVFLPGKCHGQRNLEGYPKPWGHKEWNTTLNNNHKKKKQKQQPQTYIKSRSSLFFKSHNTCGWTGILTVCFPSQVGTGGRLQGNESSDWRSPLPRPHGGNVQTNALLVWLGSSASPCG